MPAPSEVQGTTQSKTFCKWCKVPLPDNHSGHCPKCGKVGKSVTVIPQPLILRFIAQRPQIISQRRREIVKDKTIRWASRGIGLLAALGGAFSPAPLPYSLLVAIASYVITDYLSPFLLEKLIKPKKKSLYQHIKEKEELQPLVNSVKDHWETLTENIRYRIS